MNRTSKQVNIFEGLSYRNYCNIEQFITGVAKVFASRKLYSTLA